MCSNCNYQSVGANGIKNLTETTGMTSVDRLAFPIPVQEGHLGDSEGSHCDPSSQF